MGYSFCYFDSLHYIYHRATYFRGKKCRERAFIVSQNNTPIALRTVTRPLVRQDGGTPFRQERISSTPGRAFRSSRQHCLTASHNNSVNPSCVAFSGFFGRTPSMIAVTTVMSPAKSWYGMWPHNTWLHFQCPRHRIYQQETPTS